MCNSAVVQLIQSNDTPSITLQVHFNTIWERHGAVACERNPVNIFCHLSTMRERDRQTDRQTVTHKSHSNPVDIHVYSVFCFLLEPFPIELKM